MDRIVSVRFFRVNRPSNTHPLLADLLERIGNIDDLGAREKMLAPSLDVRLEVFDRDGRDYVIGEMTRIQTTNMPSNVNRGRRAALAEVDRLGHSVVFRFNKRTSILGMQYDKRILPPYRFFQYLQAFDASAKYEYFPVVRDDMWHRFECKSPRVLEIAVADPSDLSSVVRNEVPVLENMRSMGRAYSAPSITVKMSMGHRRGELAEAITNTARSLLRMRASGAIDLQKLKAKAADEEGGDEINLLEEMLEYKEELELHNKDPDVNYEIKMNYLRRCMRDVRQDA